MMYRFFIRWVTAYILFNNKLMFSNISIRIAKRMVRLKKNYVAAVNYFTALPVIAVFSFLECVSVFRFWMALLEPTFICSITRDSFRHIALQIKSPRSAWLEATGKLLTHTKRLIFYIKNPLLLTEISIS